MDESKLKKIRKHQRQNPTKFELLFRYKLRKWGIKFKEQRIIQGYIADFFLPQYDLVVEIDGAAHYTYNTVRDKRRDDTIRAAGFNVHRIRNSEVFAYEKEDILQVVNDFAVKEPQDKSFFQSYLASL